MIDIFERISENFSDSIHELEEAIKIDKTKWKQEIDVNKFYYEIGKYLNKEVQKTESETVAVMYDGNPYMTFSLALNQISKGKKLVFFVEQYMLAVNTALLAIIQKSLIDCNTDESDIKLYNSRNSLLDLIEKQNEFDRVIVLGDKFMFERVQMHVEIPITFVQSE